MDCVQMVTSELRVYVSGEAVQLEECYTVKHNTKLFVYIIKCIVMLFAVVVLS